MVHPGRRAPFTVTRTLPRSDIHEITVVKLSKQDGLVTNRRVEQLENPVFGLPREETCYKVTMQADKEVIVDGKSMTGLSTLTLTDSQLDCLEWKVANSDRAGVVDLRSWLKKSSSQFDMVANLQNWSFTVESVEHDKALSCDTYACLKLHFKLSLPSVDKQKKTRVTIDTCGTRHYLLEGCPKFTTQEQEVQWSITVFLEASCLQESNNSIPTSSIVVKVHAFKKSNS